MEKTSRHKSYSKQMFFRNVVDTLETAQIKLTSMHTLQLFLQRRTFSQPVLMRKKEEEKEK